jgi:heme exporter protein D
MCGLVVYVWGCIAMLVASLVVYVIEKKNV